MEVVKLLEAEGRTGRLWLIDSSPEFLTTITKLTFATGKHVEDELQVKIIVRFLDLIWPQASSEVCIQHLRCKRFVTYTFREEVLRSSSNYLQFLYKTSICPKTVIRRLVQVERLGLPSRISNISNAAGNQA